MVKQIFFALMLLVIVACGGGGGGDGTGGGGNGNIKLNATTVNLSFGQTFNVVATVTGLSNDIVAFSATNGTIVATGRNTATYTAPNVAGTFTITATSNADPTKKATMSVVVSSVKVSIDPTAATVAPGGKVTFTATVTGTTNLGATFTASAGTFSSVTNTSAVYTAPSTNGTYTVTATSKANTNIKATSTVTVGSVGSNATVKGQVVLDQTTTGVAGIQVQFLTASGSELARATTGSDGRFSIPVPATARSFQIVPSSLGSTYYKEYNFGTVRYSSIINGCYGPLPALTAGGTFNLAHTVELVLTTDPPPPPPNGCGN